MSDVKFLETITILDNKVLVPINRIKYINFITETNGYTIKIVSDDGEWEECFCSAEEAYIRFNSISINLGIKV